MATTLKAIIASGNVAAGATVVLPHTLNIDGVGQVPDKIELDNGAFSVVGAGDTNVTIENTSGDTASTNVLVEHWHTIERVFGASGTTALTPQPFIPASALPDSPSNIFPAGTEEIRYIRTATGNDSNDGLTPATAWATQAKGLGFLAGFSTNRSKTLDVSDCVFNETTQINFPALFGGVNFDLDFAGTGPNNFSYRTIGQIRAAQTLQQSLTVTLVSADATTGNVTLTVSEALVVNAHVGQFVIGSGLVEYGVVVSNGVNTLVLSTQNTTWTAPVGAYTPSCIWTAGDAANFFQQATYMNAFCHFTLQGIDFRANGAAQAALTVLPSMPFNLQLCKFQGLIVESAAIGTMDACHITRRFGQNGSSMTLRSSFFQSCTFNNHGDGALGLGQIQGCWFEACDPVLAGNFESRMGLSMIGCEISNATAQGLIFRGANVGLLQDTRIANSGGVGVQIDAPCRLQMDGVVGTGNVGYGVQLRNGAQVTVVGTTPTITGTIADIDLGGAGATAWGAIPATDVGAGAPQFCRVA